MDPSTGPTQSPISTSQRHEMLLFLTQIFVSHAGITNNGLAHTDSVRFCHFWFNRLQQNGCMGAYRVINLEQFPVWISKDKALTPLTKFGICSFFFSSFVTLLSFFLLSFFLCIDHSLEQGMSLVRVSPLADWYISLRLPFNREWSFNLTNINF